jgi:hypothetical protein
LCFFTQNSSLNDDEHSDTGVPNLDLKFENERARSFCASDVAEAIAGDRGGPSHFISPDRSDRPFLEDNASESFAPSTKRIFFVSFLVLLGVGGTLAWRSYTAQATHMSRAAAPSLAELSPGSASKPAAPPVGAEELQQRLNIAIDLADVKRTLKQLAANQDQITRTQEQMAQRIAILQAAEQQKLSPPPPPKPVQVPRPKPVQHPAQVSTQASSKPPQ